MVTISGITGLGMEALLGEIELGLEAEQRFVDVELTVPFSRHDLVDRFHSTGRVEETSYDERGTVLTGKLPEALLAGFAPYVTVVELAASAGRDSTIAAPSPERLRAILRAQCQSIVRCRSRGERRIRQNRLVSRCRGRYRSGGQEPWRDRRVRPGDGDRRHRRGYRPLRRNLQACRRVTIDC